MSSQTHHQRTQTGHLAATLLRRFATGLFAAIVLNYVLYPSNLILLRPSCPLPSAVFSTHAKTDSRTNDSTNYPTDQQQETLPNTIPQKSQRYDTELKHIVFCIASSSSLWDHRKEYLKVWWRLKETRAVVWVDQKVRQPRNEALPEIRISGNTARFKYTNGKGQKSALRISRVVSETLRLKMKDVRWFVMGDDDTVFMVENLVSVLSKYDHRQLYYVGSSSESHTEHIFLLRDGAWRGSVTPRKSNHGSEVN